MDIKSLVDPPSTHKTTDKNEEDENPFLSRRSKTGGSGSGDTSVGSGGLSSFASLLASLNEEMSKMPDDEVEKVGEQVEGMLKMGSSSGSSGNNKNSSSTEAGTTGTEREGGSGEVEMKEQSDDR